MVVGTIFGKRCLDYSAFVDDIDRYGTTSSIFGEALVHDWLLDLLLGSGLWDSLLGGSGRLRLRRGLHLRFLCGVSLLPTKKQLDGPTLEALGGMMAGTGLERTCYMSVSTRYDKGCCMD